MRSLILSAAIALGLPAAALAQSSEETMVGGAPAPMVGMANPAAVYCAEQGGTSRTARTSRGLIGLCDLPDGVLVDEWELFWAQSADIRVRDEIDEAAKRYCILRGGMVLAGASGFDMCVLGSGESQVELVAVDAYRRDNTAYDTGEPIEGPATLYCRETGGAPQTLRQLDWTIGVCKLPDGSVVEEWEHYRTSPNFPF